MRLQLNAACLAAVLLVAAFVAAANANAPGRLPLTRAAANAAAREELTRDMPAHARMLSGPRRALAQTVGGKSPSAQIFLDGPIEAMTLDSACATEVTCGGTLKVQGETVYIPRNLVCFMPANQFFWQELFLYKNAAGQLVTGLALGDNPATSLDGSPVPNWAARFTVTIAANRLSNTNHIVAALCDIAESPIIGGSGYIDDIDYATGFLTIEGSRVKVNDPTGKYGKQQSGMDPRFGVDPDNPTVRSETGYPMCIPDGGATTDADCPDRNRPKDASGNYLISFTMSKLSGVAGTTSGTLPQDPRLMAPFVVGDYVSYAGVTMSDATGDYVAAYELVANTAIYTAPETGVGPDGQPLLPLVYSAFEAALIGTGGLNVLGAGEATARTRFEGSSTDNANTVQLWAVDYNPVTGAEVLRDYGKVLPDPGSAGGLGAVQGRWRFRPPCTNSAPAIGNKGCTPPPGGSYTPPPRIVMVEVLNCQVNPDFVEGADSTNPKYRRIAGCKYRNPTIEYIWPENVPGSAMVESNFGAVPFLTQGGYYKSGTTVVGKLNPWPSNVQPQDVCGVPSVDMGGSCLSGAPSCPFSMNPLGTTPTSKYSVLGGGSVSLLPSITGPASYQYSWAVNCAAGTPGCPTITQSPSSPQATLSGVGTTSAPGNLIAKLTIKLILAAGISCPTTSWDVPVQVDWVTAPSDVLSAVASKTIAAGSGTSFAASLLCAAGQTGCTSTIHWAIASQPATGGPAVVWSPSLTASNQFTAASPTPVNSFTLAASVGQWPATATAATYTYTLVAWAGTAATYAASSSTVTTTLTITPPQETLTFSSVLFRCDKYRMTITVTVTAAQGLTSVPPGYVLNLQPYQTVTGQMAYPSGAFTGAFPTYTYDAVGVPQPAVGTPLVIKSNTGASESHPVATAEITRGVAPGACVAPSG